MGSKVNRYLLFLLLMINAISVFGFATFGLHPSLLNQFEWAPRIFAVSYRLFSIVQICVAALALFTALVHSSRFRFFTAFISISALSLVSELFGTSYGIPFGKYEYTSMLGPKFFNLVPVLIPISWFFMAVPSFALALKIDSGKLTSFTRICIASLLLLAWDITLDPAMSYLTPFWIWENSGQFYGMPLSNLFGWFVTGFFIMSILEFTKSKSWIQSLPKNYAQNFYLANLCLPLGMCLAAGLWGTLALTALIALVYAFAYRTINLSKPTPIPENSF